MCTTYYLTLRLFAMQFLSIHARTVEVKMMLIALIHALETSLLDTFTV